ncbi:MAG: glycoside hydrolase family 32 protein [Alphaproteobacteria bacterium]|nr:glycoside hydrolase family 32 protein [Alphaproteobacteria bacterium]
MPVTLSMPGKAGFNGHVQAGEILHIWMKPATRSSPSHLWLAGTASGKKQLSGPPGDDFQMFSHRADHSEDITVDWNPQDSLVSLCYAFDPESVAAAGIRLLWASPQTLASPARYQLHFAPLFGWMNDPNGLIQIDGRTHLFYQHYPHAQRWNNMHWGHAVTGNLVDWVHQPIFLHPRAEMLADAGKTGGAFSGSAIPAAGGGLRVFHTDRQDGRLPEQEWQMTATSADMISVSPSVPVIDDRPPVPGFGRDLRDPYVFKGPDGLWKMVLGGVDETAALVVLYETSDPSGATGWHYSGILHREAMARPVPAECPCVLPLDGEGQGLFVLIFGLIGHQTPVFGRLNPSFALVGRFDGHRFEEIARRELDFIGDCYAFQGFLHDTRPVGFAWAANWASVGRGRDFQSSMTFARRVVWQQGQLLMPPIETVQELRLSKLSTSPEELMKGIILPGGLAEIQIRFANEGPFQITFNHPDGPLHLIFDGSQLEFSVPQAKSRPRNLQQGVATAMPRQLSIYADVGLIEIYADGGRLVGTKRIDSDAAIASLQLSAPAGLVATAEIWRLRPRAGM